MTDIKSDKLSLSDSKPWYHNGLAFQCTECGKCCTGQPGYTWVTEEEVHAMAAYLRISLNDFVNKYLRKVGANWSLLENPKSYDCVFLKDKKCSIYPVRPTQCRTFPWWTSQLTSPEAWEAASRHCEGIRKEAPIVPYEQISLALSQESNSK